MSLDKETKSNVILMAGILLLGLVYYFVKAIFDNQWVFVLVVVAYLAVLKWISKLIPEKLRRK